MNGLTCSRPGRKSGLRALPLWIGLMFAPACGVLSPEKTPVRFGSPQPIVIQTMPETPTPSPVDTPDHAATHTALAAAATAQRAGEEATVAAQTEFAAGVLADIEQKLGSVGEKMGYGAVIWLHPDAVDVGSSDSPEVQFSPVDPSVQAGDFAFHFVVRWATNADSGGLDCLVGFRTGNDIRTDPWYSFRLLMDPGDVQAKFDFWQNGVLSGPGRAKATDAVRLENGAENEVILIARGNQFDAYVNGRQVLVWWNSVVARGGFGLGALARSGSGVCSFRDNWIWEWV
jgi:hypothetical protein